ncbi:hypothetical protein ACFE04_020151 [Oxalis oulophora]
MSMESGSLIVSIFEDCLSSCSEKQSMNTSTCEIDPASVKDDHILGLIVGLVPTLRATLIGDKAPLRVIQGYASLLGEAAIPTVTLIVGANLLKGLKGSEMPPQLIVGIVVVRYIALPMLGVAIIKGAIHFGFIPLDPLYQFVLLLQFALPPAMNIGTITQLFGVAESECPIILLWTYALASVSITLWSTFFLWLCCFLSNLLEDMDYSKQRYLLILTRFSYILMEPPSEILVMQVFRCCYPWFLPSWLNGFTEFIKLTRL